MKQRRVIYLASGNTHKAAELQALAGRDGLPVEVRSAAEIGGMPRVDEDAGTFVGNARKKARALRDAAPAGAWVLADDSGLCVDALGGAPGVDSAYYAGAHGDPAANRRKLLEALEGVPKEKRGAHFICVLLLLSADGSEEVAEGRCVGTILDAPRGDGGFGYDPLFAVGEQAFAELGAEEKNRLSHRARAWSALANTIRRWTLPAG